MSGIMTRSKHQVFHQARTKKRLMGYPLCKLPKVARMAVLALALVCAGGAPPVLLPHTQSSPLSDLVVAPAASKAQPALQSASIVRVIDGDTLVVDIGGQQDKVRLIGVDAPESVHPDKSRNTPAGKVASDYTQTLVAPGQIVWLQKDVSDTDRYGRLLCYVWVEKPTDVRDTDEVKTKMLNALIEEAGHAKPLAMPPDTAYASVFQELAVN